MNSGTCTYNSVTNTTACLCVRHYTGGRCDEIVSTTARPPVTAQTNPSETAESIVPTNSSSEAIVSAKTVAIIAGPTVAGVAGVGVVAGSIVSHVSTITGATTTESLEQEMDSALAKWEEKENSTPEEEWATLQQIVYNTAKTWEARQKTPGLVRHQRPGATLMSRRDQAHQRVLQARSTRSTTAAYKDACRLLQKRTSKLKSDWWERKAVELQRAADRNDVKGFYNGLKEVCGPKKKEPVHLKSTDGTETFFVSKRVVARWRK
ncbi:hypothetical protein NP493_712g00031 [Ridgeia piscesae]|uniref:EGF-like domain-containing protein n=1 Tax=Ridgeia piscesae TaxID=27915 RepID=A0AAD9KQW4_RIDPI|nr:hypothetical protein NP493_712g00031 [Ridgeia piscesae]